MATLERVAQLVAALPGVTEADRRGSLTWAVAGKTFAWERDFSKADLRRFGSDPVPAGPVLAVRTADLGEKAALLATGSPGLFTIPHFDGYSAVLVALPAVADATLREVLLDGWLALAPPALAREVRAEPRTAG